MDDDDCIFYFFNANREKNKEKELNDFIEETDCFLMQYKHKECFNHINKFPNYKVFFICLSHFTMLNDETVSEFGNT
ncbi:MAG: hypothetical protein MHPSP_000701, partial [Paramarteilia canceri]